MARFWQVSPDAWEVEMLAEIVVAMLAAGTPATAAAPAPTPTPLPAGLRILPGSGSAGSVAPQGSLANVAKSVKLRLPAGERRVITNETVHELAAGVELTTGGAGVGGGDDVVEGSVWEGEDKKRAYWQKRYQDAQARVRDLESEIYRLEGEVAKLETQFYATDDPAQRDGVVKPAWDKALVDLRNARGELAQARSEPEKVMTSARQDGALPGWFRDAPPAEDLTQPPITLERNP